MTKDFYVLPYKLFEKIGCKIVSRKKKNGKMTAAGGDAESQ
jgi:hypothetical protein